MAGYPEAELEAVRLSTAREGQPEVVLVYRVLTGPAEGTRLRLSALVGSVQYLDLPDEPLEEGEYGNRSEEGSHHEEEATSQEGGEEDSQEDDGQHCECYYCESCPHEEAIYCQACEPDEDFWEE